MRALTPVLVTWHDAFGSSEQWTRLDDLEGEPRLIRTAGFLVSSDDGHVVVALSYDEAADAVDSLLHIPEGMVQELRPLT